MVGFLLIKIYMYMYIAKKEDNPEEALKEFKAIVEQEEEMGDWYAILTSIHILN